MYKFIIFLLFPILSMAQQQIVATLKLADGTYIVNAPSGRSWVNYEAVGIHSPQDFTDTTIVDDSEINNITYYGNWRVSTSGIFQPGDPNCNCSWSQNSNDSLVFKFTNVRRLEWYGEKMSHHGILDLYWEDQFITTIDTYSATTISLYRHWFIDNLDTAKTYKFKLVATGNKNLASTGSAVVNHGFILINTPEQGDTIFPSPPDIVRVIDLEFSITREGRFQIYIGDSLDIGEHNEYEKAIEHALRSKALNPTKDVTIKSPIRRIELK